ncbi:MAG: hypothetical protein E7044_10440 [Lentisphaerae bacterium]|nr:hypothetical protein [Lentisphaerota bacterium]
MKKFIIAALFSAIGLSAAVTENFTVQYTSSSRSRELIRKTFKEIPGDIPFAKDIQFFIKYPEAPAGTFWRFSCDLDSSQAGSSNCYISLNTKKYLPHPFEYSKGKNHIVLYFEQLAEGVGKEVQFRFAHPGVLSNIKLERLEEEDLKNNLFPSPSAAQANWRTVWGKPVQKTDFVDDDENPFEGKVLKSILQRIRLGNGVLATRLLPYVPGRKYRVEMWVRGDNDGLACFNIRGKASDNRSLNIPLKKEWKKVTVEGTTSPAGLGERETFYFIISTPKNNQVMFYLSDFQFRYL